MHDSFSMTQANYLQEVEITEMLSVKILDSEGFYLLTQWPKNEKKKKWMIAVPKHMSCVSEVQSSVLLITKVHFYQTFNRNSVSNFYCTDRIMIICCLLIHC